MSTHGKRKHTVTSIDTEQRWYVLQSSNHKSVCTSPQILSSMLSFSWGDLQLAGLGNFRDLTEFVLKTECISSHSEVGGDSNAPTFLMLPSRYTNSVFDAIERFILKHKIHQRYTATHRKLVKGETPSTLALPEVFKDITLDDIYLLLEFAHEYKSTKLSDAVGTWLVIHVGLNLLCTQPPTSRTATAVGLEMAKVILEEHKLQFLKLDSSAHDGAFFWLDIIQCSSFYFSNCTREQQKQPQLLLMSLLKYDGYLRRSDHAKGILYLDFRDCQWLKDSDLQFVSQLPSLRHLNLQECYYFTDTGLFHITTLTSLQYLNLSNSEITDRGLACLRFLVSLQHLDLSEGTQFTDAGLASIRNLTSLKHLNLCWCANITGAGLVCAIENLTLLQHLNLFHCYELTDTGLTVLPNLVSLQYLKLSECYSITDAGLFYIRDLTSLQHLDLSECDQFTDTGLVHLRDLTSLQHLYLSNCDKITDTGLAHLRHLSLQILDLNGCEFITDVGLGHLNLKSLQSLKSE
jgi:hypothetical protein